MKSFDTMKTFRFFLLAFFFSVSLTDIGQAQENSQELEKMYINDFNLTRETIFLHLNKTSVVPGENLWLSAYVYDTGLHMPNQETVNLSVAVYDEKGTHLDTKVLYIFHGKGAAFIHLDPERFIPGNYFVRASTNYMQNFKEDLSYTQTFEVLGKQSPVNNIEESFDLQLLPEGGHLLAGVVNSVGVKLINNRGNGIAFEDAVLLEAKKAEVTTFKSNEFGIARFFFTPEAEKEYTLKLRTENGKEIEKKISGAEKTGIALVTTANDDHFLLSLRTNLETREKLEDEDFLIAMHRDGQIKTLEFSFPEDQLEANIIISKDSLFTGVNTITIFDGKLQPRLERLIFNEKRLKRAEVRGRMTENQGDSIVIQLASKPNINNASLSISVLPSGTLANNPNHNILSTFWLRPYVRGTIDKGHYYFSKGRTERKNRDLDLLLLTQGWSKYSWKDSSKNETEEAYKRVSGFDIVGRVEGRRSRKEKTLLIRSEQESGFFEIVPINDDNSFKLENVHIEDSTALSFSLINEKKKEMRKPAVHFNIYPLKSEKNASEIPEFTTLEKSSSKATVPLKGFIGEAVMLDTVMLTTKKKIDERYGGDVPLIEQKIEITEKIVDSYHYLKDFIATQGFRVQETSAGSAEITSRFHSSIRSRDLRPIIYFNGARIGREFALLSTLTSSQVESVTISRRGNGEGMEGVNGVIKIEMKKGEAVRGKEDNTVTSIITSNGFAENKEFYTPKYSSYSHSAFSNYGVIDWISNLRLDSRWKTELKVLNVLHPEMTLYIEGMNLNGVLFSEVLTVKTR